MPPRVFRVEKDVLTNPLWGPTHSLRSKLMLMACKVSGDASLTAKYLQKLPMSSSTPGDQVRKNSTQFTSIAGPQFCDERQINSISPSVTHVLEFLQTLYERDLSYSTINTARAALNCYLLDHKLHNTPYTLSTHPFVNRYMKGVFNSRTPTPKYSDTWDVKIVLDFIKNWHPLTDLALKHVTYKLVMMLALTTGQRCQTLASLDTQTMTKTAEQFVFRLTDHMKVSTVHVRRYHQADLCVYQTLEHYLARTSTLRSSSKLFVSVVKPHGAVTTSTVSR